MNGNTLSGMTSDFRGDPGPSRLLGLVGWMFAALALVGGTVLAAVLMPGPLGSAVRQIEAAPELCRYQGRADHGDSEHDR